MDELLGCGGVGDFQVLRVPLQFLAAAVRDDTQQYGFGQSAGVVEVAGRCTAGFDGVDPLFVMADRLGDEGIGAFEAETTPPALRPQTIGHSAGGTNST